MMSWPAPAANSAAIRAGMSRCGMWSTRTLTPFFSPHSLANLSYQASYAGMKWLHCRMRSVVPLICAGAWRASSIVNSELPATPAPAVVRKFLRLRVDGEGLSGCSIIVGLLKRSWRYRGLATGNPRKELDSLCCLDASCQVGLAPGVSSVNAPTAPGSRGGHRRDRSLHGRTGVAPGYPQTPGRRAEGRAALPGSLRDVPRGGRAGLVARGPLPGPARQAERRVGDRPPIRSVSVRSDQERRRAHRQAR